MSGGASWPRDFARALIRRLGSVLTWALAHARRLVFASLTIAAVAVLTWVARPSVAILTWAARPSVATAQPAQPEKPDPSSETADEVISPDSPRASLSAFLDLCRTGRYGEAALYLDLPKADRERGPLLAARLKAVLDRHAWFDLSLISPSPLGDVADGLPPVTDEIAKIPGPAGETASVRLVRREGTIVRWRFSQTTVGHIDAWYERLEGRWVRDHLPEPLLRAGPGNLLYWQWLVLPLVLLGAWAIGYLFSRLTRLLFHRIVKGTSDRWDSEVIARIGRPLTLAWSVAAAYVFLPWLGLYDPALELLHRWLRGGAFVAFFWVVARTVDVARQVVSDSAWARDHAAARSLLPLGARVGKVILVAVAAVALLSEFGYPVASLVAGLGIGGLAFALAAQKTVENLFGAFSIGADQPFREGDFVRIEDFVGTVEAIGLRSTRFRTLDRTVISIPNGKLADMRLESFSARDRIRLACTLGLVYETTAEKMRQVLSGLERTLCDHPKIWPDSVIVRFKEFGDSSLNVEVMAWFQTVDWAEFQLIRQEVLMGFMEEVEKAGSGFAFPTRTVHVVRDGGGSPSVLDAELGA